LQRVTGDNGVLAPAADAPEVGFWAAASVGVSPRVTSTFARSGRPSLSKRVNLADTDLR